MNKTSLDMRRPLALAAVLLATGMVVSCGHLEAARNAAQKDADAAPTPATPNDEVDAGGTVKDDKKPEAARIYKGSGVLLRPPAPAKVPAAGDVSLNFEAADVRDIAKTVLAEILRESYIVDPKVAGTISFRTTNPLPRESLLPTLETVLRMNGIVMVKENGIFKIMPAATAKGSLSPRLGGSAVAGFSLQVVPLKYAGAKEMAKILEGIATDPAAVKVDEIRNLLILAGTQNEIQHMMDTIDMFDVDWLSGMSVGLFILQNADVKTVEGEMTKILGDKSANPLAGAVRVVPIERLNGFVVITPQPHYLEQAKIWLERLDKAGATAGGSRLYVYRVQNGKAEHIAELLNQTFAAKTQAPGGAPRAATLAPGLAPAQIGSTTSGLGTTGGGFGQASGGLGSSFGGLGSSFGAQATRPAGMTTMAPAVGTTLSITDESGSASEVRVVADRENNSLLILTNPAGYEKIESALKKLDSAPRQVLIEVMIAEVTLTDELKYGVEWAITSGSRKSFQLDVGAAGIGKLTPGFSYALADAAGTGIKAVLNALATNDRINVLSSPHVMVADNQTAKVQVGDSVPIQGQQTITTGGAAVVSSVQYLDTGIILSVTPRINSSGLVNLDITQEFSIPGAINTALSNSPTISRRATKTQVTVQSGETMVLGGLISEKSTDGSGGLPFLSSIPVLGGLFGTTDRLRTKTELIVLITPRVAQNVGQAKAISDELQRKMGETKDLMDCGTSSVSGLMTSRGGLWCLQARRFDGSIDKMKIEDERGIPLYLKEEAKRAQDEAQRAVEEAKRLQDAAQKQLQEATRWVQETSPAVIAPSVSAPQPAVSTAPAPTPAPTPAAPPKLQQPVPVTPKPAAPAPK